VRVWIGSRALKLAVKCLVTAGLLFVAFRTVNLTAVSSLFSQLSFAWTAAAFFLTALIIVADAALLERTLRMFERRMPFGTALLYSLVGWFFSNVAPSTVGGDFFRGVQLSRAGMPLGAAVRLIVAIRAMSFATLVFVMLMGFPIALKSLSASRDCILLATVLFGAAGATCGLFIFAQVPLRVPSLERWSIVRKIERIAVDFRMLLSPTSAVALPWLMALAQHLLRVGTLACLAAGLGLQIPLATLFAFTPAALLMAMIPISFGGWGLRELTFVYLLGTAGVSAEAALSLSIAFGLLRIVVGAIGGASWALMSEDYFRLNAPTV
jgi:glycosyltransferase 2 family protein